MVTCLGFRTLPATARVRFLACESGCHQVVVRLCRTSVSFCAEPRCLHAPSPPHHRKSFRANKGSFFYQRMTIVIFGASKWIFPLFQPFLNITRLWKFRSTPTSHLDKKKKKSHRRFDCLLGQSVLAPRCGHIETIKWSILLDHGLLLRKIIKSRYVVRLILWKSTCLFLNKEIGWELQRRCTKVLWRAIKKFAILFNVV